MDRTHSAWTNNNSWADVIEHLDERCKRYKTMSEEELRAESLRIDNEVNAWLREQGIDPTPDDPVFSYSDDDKDIPMEIQDEFAEQGGL